MIRPPGGHGVSRRINRGRDDNPNTVIEDGSESGSPLGDVMEEIRRELVQRAAAADRDANREIYDALETE